MITLKDVEEAIAVTRNRWEKMTRCKTYIGLTFAIFKTRCGLCDLSSKAGKKCIMGLCPLFNNKSCHPAYGAYCSGESLDKITILSKQLLEDLDGIDKVSLVRKVNKALDETSKETGKGRGISDRKQR